MRTSHGFPLVCRANHMARLLTISRRGERTAPLRGLGLDGWMSPGAGRRARPRHDQPGGSRLWHWRRRVGSTRSSANRRTPALTSWTTMTDLPPDCPRIGTVYSGSRSRSKGVDSPRRLPNDGPGARLGVRVQSSTARHKGLRRGLDILRAGQIPSPDRGSGWSSIPHEEDALGDTISRLRRRDPSDRCASPRASSTAAPSEPPRRILRTENDLA